MQSDLHADSATPAVPSPCTDCDRRALAFCAGLPEGDRQALNAMRGHLQYPADTTIFREGDESEAIYTVVSGTVKTYKMLTDGRRQIINFLHPGDFFGVPLSPTHTFTADTVTPTALCRFPAKRFRQLISATPTLQARLFGHCLAEVQWAHDHMLLLGRMTAREKVASFLLCQSRKAVVRGEPASPVGLPMSRTDIADYLGLTIETVSRVMTGLKKDGLIALPNPVSAVLLDVEALKLVAEGG